MTDKKAPAAEALPKNRQIAYVREMRHEEIAAVEELPADVGRLYAVHDANGERLAVFDNRDAAFAIARNNDFAPVSVH